MRKHIATGTMGSAWGNILTGIIYVYFGNAIGLTRLQWGILGGISSWVVVMQPLGTMLADRVGSRRLVWFWTALSDRVLRMVGIVGAFLLWRAGSTAGYLVFMTAVCLGTLLGNLSPGAWFGWLSTIIPRGCPGDILGPAGQLDLPGRDPRHAPVGVRDGPRAPRTASWRPPR